MANGEPVRFPCAPFLVFLSMAATSGANAIHCNEGTPMVQVFPCGHDESKKEIIGYHEEPSDAEERIPGMPAGFEFKKTEAGAYVTTNVTVEDGGGDEDLADVYVPPLEDDVASMKLDQHKHGPDEDARDAWAAVNKFMFSRYPEGTRLSDDLNTIIFPGDTGCMRDEDIGYPQPLEIDEDGNYTLKYPNDQSIAFPAHYTEESIVEDDGTMKKEVTLHAKLHMKCKNSPFGIGELFGNCKVPFGLGFVPGFNSGHRLLFEYTGPGFRFDFRPVNSPAPVYDGGTAGGTGPVTRWNLLHVDGDNSGKLEFASTDARLKLESDPEKNLLREPEECETEGEKEYWILDCSGEVEYYYPVQPSLIPCCLEPCPEDDPPIDTT